MTNIKFPKTDLVQCVFSFRSSNTNVLSDFETKSFAPVVCKVDLGTFIEAIEKAKQLKAMKAAIDREKKRLESMVTYELIAEKSPEFKAMLEQFKAMGGEF